MISFWKKYPHRLPRIRRIEHQIDFFHEALILNRPAYRSNPKEVKKLLMQVEELLTKGYVWDSMTPCIMLVLLVSKKDWTWRMLIYYQAINKNNVKYHHPFID